MATDKNKVHEICRETFGTLPAIRKAAYWGVICGGSSVSDGNEGKWEVVIEAGLGVTGERSREDFRVFDTKEEAVAFARDNSNYWYEYSYTGSSRPEKGNRQ